MYLSMDTKMQEYQSQWLKYLLDSTRISLLEICVRVFSILSDFINYKYIIIFKHLLNFLCIFPRNIGVLVTLLYPSPSWDSSTLPSLWDPALLHIISTQLPSSSFTFCPLSLNPLLSSMCNLPLFVLRSQIALTYFLLVFCFLVSVCLTDWMRPLVTPAHPFNVLISATSLLFSSARVIAHVSTSLLLYITFISFYSLRSCHIARHSFFSSSAIHAVLCNLQVLLTTFHNFFYI